MFHFEPEKGIGAQLHWIIHGVHHDHPNDPLRLVMPPALSVPLAALFVYGLLPGDRQPRASSRSAPPSSTGYLGYDMLHYHVHHHRPKSALGKRLRELHMRHHFQDHERGYGVSAPFWDHVFGTAPKKTPASGAGGVRCDRARRSPASAMALPERFVSNEQIAAEPRRRPRLDRQAHRDPGAAVGYRRTSA